MTVPRNLSDPFAHSNDLIGFYEIDLSSEGRKQIVSKIPGNTALITL
jgi:hypothetical protein